MKLLTAHIISILVCLACYCDTLDGDFVFDDTAAILTNKDVVGSTSSLQEIFNHDFWGNNITDPTSHKSYRPLTTLMFRLEYNYFKLRSFAMKSINLLIHCLNSSLLLQLLYTLTDKMRISFITSILFAVHPIHVEAVCGIVGRAELMFGLCFLLSLKTYTNINSKEQPALIKIFKYLTLVALSTLGVLFKENAISILPSCLCYDIIIRTNLLQKGSNRLFVKKVVLARCGFVLVITLILLISRLYIQNFESPKFKEMDNPIGAMDDYFSRFLSQSYLYILNSWLLLCPEWLSYDWAMGCIQIVETLLDFRCLLVVVFYWAVYCLSIKPDRLISLALVILVVPFLPASGIIRVGFVIAERILYVPSIGFCLLISLGFTGLVDQFSKIKHFFYILLLMLMITYIFRTRQRAKQWLTEEKLFYSALGVCPNNAKIHYNIARLATDKGRKDAAFEHYHKAVRLYPQYETALMNLGNLYRKIGDFRSAEKYLKDSIEALEEFPSAWMNLGIVQASQKNYDTALQSYNKALLYKKVYPNCLYNMGNLYIDMKNYSLAMKYWQESVALNPKQQKAWANILTLLDNQALYDDVLRVSARALIYVPNSASIMFIRANVLGKLKNYIEAEQIYLQVIKLKPNNALYHHNLGVLYHIWRKRELAIESYRTALKLDRNMKSAKTNLDKLLRD